MSWALLCRLLLILTDWFLDRRILKLIVYDWDYSLIVEQLSIVKCDSLLNRDASFLNRRFAFVGVHKVTHHQCLLLSTTWLKSEFLHLN